MDIVSNPRLSTAGTAAPGTDPAGELPGPEERDEAIQVWMGGGGFFRPLSATQGGASMTPPAGVGQGASGGSPFGAGLAQGLSLRMGTVVREGGDAVGGPAALSGGGATVGLMAGGTVGAAMTRQPVSASFAPVSATGAPNASDGSDDLSDTASVASDVSTATTSSAASAASTSSAASSASSQSSVDGAPSQYKDGQVNPYYVAYEGEHASVADTAAATAAATAGTDSTDGTDDGTDTTSQTAQMPSSTDTRPKGDVRSAEDIVNANPTLKNMGNQENILTNLKKQCGDWTDPSLTPDQRADAAYRASEVVNYVKSSAAADGTPRSADVTDDGKIDGFTASKEARHGTEAGIMKDFGEKGYSALPADHRLPTTNDKYVNKDGTTKSNAKVIGETIAKAVLKIVQVFAQIASQILSVIADLKIPGISQLAALASVGEQAISSAANVGTVALNGGDVKKAAEQMGIDVAEQAVSSLTVPGAGKALGKGIEAGVEAGESTAQRAAKSGAEQLAGDAYGQYASSNAATAS